jgi:hypothetical protein
MKSGLLNSFGAKLPSLELKTTAQTTFRLSPVRNHALDKLVAFSKIKSFLFNPNPLA